MTTNLISPRSKIIIIWLILTLGWIIHHVYGLFNIYYQETLIIDGATGETPLAHHMYRILFEGMSFLFAILTLQLSKIWFRWIALVWAVLSGLYNFYHLITAAIYEATNVSEIFILFLMVLASAFLVKEIRTWIDGKL